MRSNLGCWRHDVWTISTSFELMNLAVGELKSILHLVHIIMFVVISFTYTLQKMFFRFWISFVLDWANLPIWPSPHRVQTGSRGRLRLPQFQLHVLDQQRGAQRVHGVHGKLWGQRGNNRGSIDGSGTKFHTSFHEVMRLNLGWVHMSTCYFLPNLI